MATDDAYGDLHIREKNGLAHEKLRHTYMVMTLCIIATVRTVYPALLWELTYEIFFFPEFAENGSIYDYIYKEHKKPPLSQILLWATQVAEGMVMAGNYKSHATDTELIVNIIAKCERIDM